MPSRALIIAYLILLSSLSGCLGERQIHITPNPDSLAANPLPLSVRIDLRRFERHVNPATPINLDLKKAIQDYVSQRGTFRQVVDGPSDAVLSINADFVFAARNEFHYKFIVNGVLNSQNNTSLGQYKGIGEATWSSSRITDAGDIKATNLALNLALDKMFSSIEREYQFILTKLQRNEPAAVGMAPLSSYGRPSPNPPGAPMSSVVIPTSDVDRVPALKSVSKKNAYAIVIGIEQYREKLPKADFADRDAKLVGEYLTKVMGYPEENVVVRTNDKASLTDLLKYFENWLPNNVEKDSSVFIYYSGHGAPNPKTGDAYMVPYDGDPTFVDATGYPMKRLYTALDKLSVKDVTVVLDSCFSGAGGRSVLAKGAKPIGLSVEQSLGSTGKALVLTASGGDQISSAYEEKGHGLLTYFFLKGLQGEGDLNKDGNINMAELYDYVKPNVSKVARKQYNNEQTPQLLVSPEVLRQGGGKLIEAHNP